MKFKKKPIIIDAIQYTGDNATEILHWMFPDLENDAEANELTIKTLEGEMKVSKNDWVIKGVNGEFYPCKPDIFDKSYDKIN
jgi:hypothetical protein